MMARDLGCAYTPRMDFVPLRESLRKARDTLGWTLDQAAQKSGLNRATIHSIENVKREPDLKSDLDTLETLARSYGLVLSFTLSDDPPTSGLKRLSQKGQNPPLGGLDAAQLSGVTDLVRLAVARMFVEAGTRLNTPPEPGSRAAEPRSEIPKIGRAQSEGRRRRA